MKDFLKLLFPILLLFVALMMMLMNKPSYEYVIAGAVTVYIVRLFTDSID